MAWLTVEQAAKRLNRTERTIRRWITEEHKLTEHHPPHGHTNKFLVDAGEVEALAVELAQYEQPGHKQGPAAASEGIEKRLEFVEHWIQDLQRWHSELEQRITALEKGVSIAAAHQDSEASFPLLQSQPEAKRTRTRKTETPASLPSGSMQYWQFAKLHNVPRGTFREHITIGMRRTGEKVEAVRIGNAYWLTPDQQKAVLDFWKRHGVHFTLPHEQDQEETRL